MPLFTLHQDPILGTLRFRKVNASGQPITNAVFRLTGTSSIHGQIHDLSNTNQKYLTSVHTGNGWYEIRDVPYGRAGDTYTVTETTVPAGYKAVTFTVAGSNFQEHGLTYEYTEVNGNVVDPVATGTVTLTKVNASGARVNGAVFTISGTGLDGKAFSIDSNTGSNGVYTFSKVPVGTTANYTIKEKTPPTGYNLPQNNSFTFRGNLVTKDGTYAYPTNITDPVATGELRFAKQNAAGRRLNGAVFTITGTSSYSGKAFTLTSTPIHSNGAYRIPDIPVGKSTDVYTVTETTTPPGYKPVTFTIKGNQIPAGSALTLPDPVTDPVATGTVWFRKYTESGDAMRGGDFKIEGTGLDGVPFSIDAIYWYGGRYRAFNVPAGAAGSIYTLTETGAPAGFKNVSFTIPGDAVAAAIAANVRYDYPDPVVDPTNTGTLRFTKVNEGNGPLTGAQFVMTGHSSYRGDFGPLSSVDLYQESVDAGSPDETLRGVYEIRNVPYGLVGDEYDVEETVVPAGYEAVSFKVTGDHFQTDGATYTLPDPVVDPLEQLKYTLTVTNTVENGKGDPRFPFEITITDPNAGEAYKPDPSTVHVYDTNGEVPNGATVDPSTGLVSVPELGDVWRVEIENVPAGDSVVVRETSHPGYDVHIGGAGTADPNDPDATQPITMNGNKTVAFTNRRNTGDLTLTNTVIGGPADKTFPFEITITDPNGDPYTPDPSKIHDQNGNAVPGVTVDNGKVSVPALGDGDVIVIEDIPKGSTVQITEKEHASYTVSIGGDGSPSAGDPATSEPITIDGDKTVAFTNEYTVYPFTVTNTIVNGPNGKTFPFEIVITKPDGTTRYISPGDKVKVFNGTTEVPNGAEVDPGTGLITVPALGNGWKVVVEDVPAESTAVVTQTDYTGYSVSIGGDGTAATGTPNVSNPVSIDGPKTVDFTSSRALMSVTVTKTVTGGGVDTRFPISVEVTMQDPLALSARVYDANDDEDTTRTVRITGGSVGVELANGERIVIENIPKGSTLAVTETQHDGYTVLINNLTDGGTTSGDSVSGVNINQPTTIEVVNNPGYELPHTGGAGTSLYALGGTALTGLALVYGLTRRRRKGEA